MSNFLDLNNVDRLFHGTTEIKTLLWGTTVIWEAPAEPTVENLLWNRVFIRGNLSGQPGQEGDSGLGVQFITCQARSRQNSLKMMQGLDITMPYRCVGRTENGIMMWEPVCTIGFENRYSNAIACKPDDDDIWLVAIGAPSAGASGQGIYRHTAYGQYPIPWTKVQAINTIGAGGGSSWGLQFRRMGCNFAWSLSNTQIVYYLNSWGQHNSTTIQGQIYRSTNAGQSFSEMSTNAKINALGRVYALEVDPTDPTVLFAATSNGVFKSADSGANWTEVSNGIPNDAWCTSLQINEMDKNHLRIFVYQTGVFGDTSGEGVYESTNGGASWSRVFAFKGVRVDSAPWDRFDQYIVFANNVAGAGKSRYHSSSHNFVQIDPVPSILGWEAADGFWPKWHGQFRAKGGPDAEAMCGVSWDPEDRDRYAGTARCTMWEAALGDPTEVRNAGMGYAGEAWGECNLNSLYQIEGNPNVFGVGMFDYGLTYTLNGWGLWTRGGAPNPYSATATNIAVAICPDLDGRVVSLGGDYGPASQIFSSSNWGVSYTGHGPTSPTGSYTKSCFLDWHQTNTNFVFTDKYRSSDKGATWEGYWDIDNASNPFPGNATNSGRVVGMCRGNCDVLWALGTDNRTVYRSPDRGVNWFSWYTLPSSVGNDHFLGFYPHPTNDQGFLCYFNNAVQYITGQNTKVQLGGTLPWSSADSIRCLHADPNVIYVMKATNGGPCVYATDDAGATWVDWTDNIPRTAAMRVLDIIQTTGDVIVGGTKGPSMRKGIKMIAPSLLDDPDFSVFDYGQLTPDTGGGSGGSNNDVDLDMTVGNYGAVYYGFDTGVFDTYGSISSTSLFGGTIEMMTIQSSGRFRLEYVEGQIAGLTSIEVLIPGWTGDPVIATWNGSDRYQTGLISGLGTYFATLDGQTISIGFNNLS